MKYNSSFHSAILYKDFNNSKKCYFLSQWKDKVFRWSNL